MKTDDITTPAFRCGESVTITANQRPATIDAIMIEGINVTYRVTWWTADERKQSWMAGHEIEKQ